MPAILMGCSKVAKTYELIIASRLLVGICAGKKPCPAVPFSTGEVEPTPRDLLQSGASGTEVEMDPTQALESVPRPREWSLGRPSPQCFLQGTLSLACFSKVGIEPRTVIDR